MNVNATATAAPFEYEDVQALLRFGLKHLPEATFLLLRVKDRAQARAWLKTAPVTSSVSAKPLPSTALQVAFTSEGLRALGVAADIVDGFSNEYVNGMASDPGRSRRLGDVVTSAPAQWEWGANERVPHVMVMLYAAPGLLADFQRTITAQLNAGFEAPQCLDTAVLGNKEPFGFEDGISQPKIDWERTRAVRDDVRHEYSNVTCVGEFLLGYPNEYGLYTDRPVLDAQRSGAAALPRCEDTSDKRDVGRNGSYLVLRQLQQDISGFWQYLDRQAGGDASRREQLGAAMVGRTRDGAPLTLRADAPSADAKDSSGDNNDFTFDADPDGLRCPLGAHIRRSNPRNADLPRGKSSTISRLIRTLGFDANALANDLVASTRFHRLLRRGRKYGDVIAPEQALSGARDGSESGIYFISLGANIGRQFEFVQTAWIAGTKFDGLASESDPLLGHRQPGTDGGPTNVFSIPQAHGPDMRLTDLPSFVTVRGGAYFFLPGIRALRFLATAGE